MSHFALYQLVDLRKALQKKRRRGSAGNMSEEADDAQVCKQNVGGRLDGWTLRVSEMGKGQGEGSSESLPILLP